MGSYNIAHASNSQDSRPAMPYTKQASDKLTNIIMANKNSLPTIRQNSSSNENLDLYIKYYAKLWAMAGYDFKKSMNKYVHDMSTDPIGMNSNPTYEYSLPITLAYVKLSDTCTGSQDILVLKKYFSQETINSFSNKTADPEKTQYWFPQGVAPYMLTDMQRQSYVVISEESLKRNYNIDSPFIQQKIKEAKSQGRPLIQMDIDATNKDYQILKRISNSLTDGLSQETGGECYGSLDQNQEAQLRRILNEYGDSVLDDKLKQKLQIYRQRQAHLGTQNINKTSNQYQFTNMPSPQGRNEVERFYNGFDYTPVIPSASTIKSNILQKGVNYLFGY